MVTAALLLGWGLLAGPADTAYPGGPEPSSPEAPTVHVTIWFDTEDYLLPASDDAAKRLAEIFERQGVRATFKVVGEKARVLRDRGRRDVIAALAKHDVGFHTDFHSVHPTPSEYSAGLDWEEGVSEFLRREGPGLEDLREIFGRPASCYGQPGSSWTPQSYGALREWEIPVYLDDTPHVGLEGKPFWYCGALNALNLQGYTTRSDLNDDGEVQEGCRRFDEIRERVLAEGGGLVSIYYHPCEWVHEQFWDGVNFSRGANPPRGDWQLPPRKPADVTERWFRNFDRYLEHIRKSPGVRLVTASDLAGLYRDRAYDAPFTESELVAIARALTREVSFVRLEGRCVSAAEGTTLLAEALLAAHETGRLPAAVRLTFAYGPTTAALDTVSVGEFPWTRWIEACRDFLGAQGKLGRIPSILWVAGKPVSPQDFAATLARAVLALEKEGKAPPSLKVARGSLTAARHVAEDGPDLWGWVILPEGFRAPRMMALAALQAWTLKPAVLDGSAGHP